MRPFAANHLHFNSLRCTTIGALLLFLSAGCQGTQAHPDKPLEVDNALRKLREEQAIEYATGSNITRTMIPYDEIIQTIVQQGDPSWDWTSELASVANLLAPIQSHCAALRQEATGFVECDAGEGEAPPSDPPAARTFCSYYHCELFEETCELNVLLDLASATVPIALSPGLPEGSRPTFPAPSTAQRAALAELALWVGHRRLYNHLATLPHYLPYSGLESADDCSEIVSSPLDSGAHESRLNIVFQLFRDLQQLTTESAENAANLYQSLADAQLGRYATLTAANNGVAQIREHAAALLIGGPRIDVAPSDIDPSISPDSSFIRTPGFCSLPELGPSARRALNIWRETGLPPSDIQAIPGAPGVVAPISTSDLLTRQGAPSVRARLELMRSIDSLTSALSNDEFLDYLGLSIDDFQVARAYLAQEQQTYLRDSEYILERQAPEDGGLSRALYASTTNEPETPHWSIIANRVRDPGLPHDAVPSELGRGYYQSIIQLPSALSGLYTANYIYGYVEYLSDVYDDSFPFAADFLAEMRLAVGDVRNALRLDYEGSFDVTISPGATALRIAGSSPYSHDRVWILFASRSAECALQGTVAGEPCAWDDVLSIDQTDVAFAAAAVDPEDGSVGPPPFRPHRELAKLELTSIPVGAERFWIVAQREGMPPEQPGSYEPLTSGHLYPAGTEAFGYQLVVSRHLERWAGMLLQPSPDYCAATAVSCAESGLDLIDERIALEDDLTDDGDAHESSWRRYLDLADAAAREADLLGETAFQYGLEAELRAEKSLTDLAEICGAGTSLAAIEDTMGSGALSSVADPVAYLRQLVGTSETPSNDDPGLRKILSCLEDDTNVPLVSLGSEDICVWELGAGSGRYCEVHPDHEWADENSMARSCPAFRTDGSCPLPEPFDSEVYAGVPVRTLNLFETNRRNDHGGEYGNQCHDLRLLRAALESSDEAEVVRLWELAIEATATFSPETVRSIASGIRWTESPGTFGALYVNDQPLLTTGSAAAGPAVGGLCNTAEPPVGWTFDCSGEVDISNSILCATYSCNSASDRAIVNSRWAVAAMTARWLAGYGLGEFVVPRGPAVPSGDLSAGTLTFYGAHNGAQYATAPVIGAENGVGGFYACGDAGAISIAASYDHYGGIGTDVVSDCQQDLFYRFAPTLDYADETSSDNIEANRRAAIELLQRIREVRPEDSPGSSVRLTNPLSYYLWSEISGFAWTIPVEECSGCESGLVLPWTSGHPTRRYWKMDYSLSPEGLLDALELICEANHSAANRFDVSVGPVTSADQVDEVAQDLGEAAGEIQRAQALMLLGGVPSRVADRIEGLQSSAVPESTEGKLGVQINLLHSAFIDVAGLPAEIADQVDGISRDARTVASALRRLDLQQQMEQVEFARDLANQSTNCATACTDIIGAGGPVAMVGAAANAAIVCSNVAFQISQAVKARGIQEQINQILGDEALLTFEENAANRGANLRRLHDRMQQGILGIRASLDEMEILRNQGRRALAQAMGLQQTGTGIIYRSTGAIHRRDATANLRYERTRQSAVRLAFLAKRAIEQRFGVRLSSLNQDLGYVPAPATWESQICTMSGIDYEAAASEEGHAGADGYVGDYVALLRNFVDAYRNRYPHAEGIDTAVVSLRDDVQNTLDLCPRPVGNLLYWSTELDRAASDGVGGWASHGCALDELGQPEGNCIDVAPWTEFTADEVSMDVVSSPLGSVRPYAISFGPDLPTCDPEDESCPVCYNQPDCGWHAGARYGQSVTLPAGLYRMSWYGFKGEGLDEIIDPIVEETWPAVVNRDAVEAHLILSDTTIRGATGASYATDGLGQFDQYVSHNGWYRYWYTFEVPVAQDVRIAIAPPTFDLGSGAEEQQASFLIAGLMLEDLRGLGSTEELELTPPGVFAETRDELTHLVEACEDTDGDVFRERAWRRDCMRLCDDGFAQSCPEERSTEYCYWETEFHVSQEAIDRGYVFRNAGFALGNFNYRIESLAVNFVGSAARTCEDSSLPSTCYNAGWIPYTLEHLGPYTVRNHFGSDYDAALFPGVIEHARGLAVDTYLDNPVADADRSLIGQYTQRQLRGRPLIGTYKLRVWDEPGVNFEGIRDVQILLDYRYWTRQQ